MNADIVLWAHRFVVSLLIDSKAALPLGYIFKTRRLLPPCFLYWKLFNKINYAKIIIRPFRIIASFMEL